MAGVFTGTCALGVLPVSNFQADGYPVLIPEVRKFTPTDVTFTLPERFTVTAPDTARLKIQHLDEALRRFEDVRLERTSSPHAACRLVLTDEDVPDHEEGYTLAIDETGIKIAARTERGLFYGVQTLRNMLHNIETPELRGCFIEDYPDLDRRGYTFNLRFTRSDDLPSFFRIVDAMASLKLNFLMLEFGDNFPLAGDPFSLREHTFSLEDVKAIRDFCRERHIEVGIRLQVLSHVRWMESHPEFESMLEGPPERPWYAAYCPQNELAQSLVEQTLREQLSLFRPGLCYIVYDEITNLCPFQVCEKCKARDPVELLAEHLEFATRIVEEEGALTMVAQDSFLPGRLHGEELAKHLDPERHAVLYWEYEPEVPEEPLTRFSSLGHPTIGMALAGSPYNVQAMARLNHKHDTLGCNLTYWYYSRGHFNNLTANTPETYGGIVLAANILWNLDSTPPEDTVFDPTFELRRRFDPDLQLPPLGTTAVSIPIGKAVNTELNADGAFPRLRDDADLAALSSALAGLPERFELFTADGGRYYGLVLSGAEGDGRAEEEVSIPVGGRADRLSLLLTTSRPNHQGRFKAYAHSGEYRYRFDPVAAVTLRYADGTAATRELRFRFDITDWNRLFGGYDMRFAVRGFDDRKAYFSFGIHDLPNPNPEKEIAAIAFSTRSWEGIAPALLAVSAFGADESAFAAPDVDAALARVEKEMAARERPDAPTERIVLDFEDGMGEAEVNTMGTFEGEVEHAIVMDPASPSGGRVLRMSVSPAEPEEGYPFVRVTVDMPYRLQEGARSLRVDHRITHPHYIRHASDYLVDTEGTPRRHFRSRFESFELWQRSYQALSGTGSLMGAGESPAPLKNLRKGDLRRVSFFFERIPEPITIWVDNIGESTAERHTLPLRTLKNRDMPY